MTTPEDARAELMALLEDPEYPGYQVKDEIGLAYYNGGAEIDLQALVDLIIAAGWRPVIRPDDMTFLEKAELFRQTITADPKAGRAALEEFLRGEG